MERAVVDARDLEEHVPVAVRVEVLDLAAVEGRGLDVVGRADALAIVTAIVLVGSIALVVWAIAG